MLAGLLLPAVCALPYASTASAADVVGSALPLPLWRLPLLLPLGDCTGTSTFRLWLWLRVTTTQPAATSATTMCSGPAIAWSGNGERDGVADVKFE